MKDKRKLLLLLLLLYTRALCWLWLIGINVYDASYPLTQEETFLINPSIDLLTAHQIFPEVKGIQNSF
uniref:Uncharacterized protein n=1 Tax=Glossina brevipalpis TaxID=37001 RepID=A0A1A9WNU0_9MUSC